MRGKLALAVTLIFVATVFTTYAMTANFVIGNVGAVKSVGVGVYWESTCIQTVSAINWGSMSPGDSKNVLVYVRNEGNSPVKLSMTTGNWQPANASSHLALSWDYVGQDIAANSVIPLTLKLAVLPTVQGISNFSFDIVIAAS